MGCLLRHVQVHVHYSGQKDNNNGQQREDTSKNTGNPSEIVVQTNSAYSTTNGSRIILAEKGTRLYQSNSGSHSHGEEAEYQNKATEMKSNRRAYHHRNQTQIEAYTPMRYAPFVVPVPYESPTPQDDEDHSYEYIL